MENIQESLGDNKQDDDNDDTLLWEGDLMLKTPSEVWTLASNLKEPQITLKAEMEDGHLKDTLEDVEELQVAFGDLKRMVVETRRSSRSDALDVLTHVGYSVMKIVAAID